MKSRPRQQIMTLIAIALTFGSGANDVASFTRLGGVFTSVMTGNIVLWGLSAAERSASLAAGAVLSGLLVAAAASLVPVLPLAALIITLALAWTPWSDPAR
jgi:uncharacterized membrane protein YoaK (UPF0700 family)